MNGSSRHQSIWLTVAMVVAGFALQLFPERYVVQIESVVRDSLKPGQDLALMIRDKAGLLIDGVDRPADSGNSDDWELKVQVASYKETNQRLNGELSSLRQVQRSAPLFLSTTVEARVLSTSQLKLLSQGFVIGNGKDVDLYESELVVTDDGPKIDLGKDGEFQTDSLVLASGTVIGSIHHVGRWSSSVRRVTDEGFRTSVRLLRCSGDECVFGAVGSLHGQGKPTCDLQYVSATESVEVGDLVVTNSESESTSVVSKIGVVKTASLEPGSEFWAIEVEPAFQHGRTVPAKVLVLKEVTSATRVLTN